MTLVLDSDHLDSRALEQLVALLQRHPGPTPVRLCLSDPDGAGAVIVSAGAGFTVAPNPGLRASLGALAGVVEVALTDRDDR
jgi:hypothetical protein